MCWMLSARRQKKVQEMAAGNPTRVDLIEKLEELIDAYNAGATGVEETFRKLQEFIRTTISGEDRRAAREGLSEGELAIYDLLTRPDPKLTKAQELQVKKIARELLAKLQDKLAVFQWRQRQQTRSAVRWTIERTLNELPEEPYPKDQWDLKVEETWQFILGRPETFQAGASPQ